MVGIETVDDAAVYKLNDDTAIIQTVDFFTPVVDDPYTYGQIAAANALSDIYAMGGEPKLAMNIICFPADLPCEVVKDILKGGYDKVREAGALLVGGHTMEDQEPKYGLAVIGFVHPERVVTNCNAQVGDLLVLTKPLGLGILTTAMKAQAVDAETYRLTVNVMGTLNKHAKDAMVKVGVHSCTDITGFGLLGHGLEMAQGSGVTLKFRSAAIPIIKEALSLAAMGFVPAGAYANMNYISGKVAFGQNVPRELMDCLYDPQTSGGLLISVNREKADYLLAELQHCTTEYAVVGEVIEQKNCLIIVE